MLLEPGCCTRMCQLTVRDRDRAGKRHRLVRLLGAAEVVDYHAADLGQFGITANAVAPGFIATDMTAATAARLGMTFEDFQAAVASRVPADRIGEVDDVARTISFLASEGAGYVSGQVIYVSGGPLC